ncbi:citrate synthase [Candidatus Sumerlaeota bacterium]|nr:citrate synthase [Candidatus Sumerlaeota bacterium]
MSDGLHECKNAMLALEGSTVELPVWEGTEGERGIDITQLRGKTSHITLDSGFANTGSCVSKITFIDGEKGVLRYRGIPIEQLAEHSTFLETAWLLIYGELPMREQLKKFSKTVAETSLINESLHYHFEGFPRTAHPMPMISAMINAMGCYQPALYASEGADFDIAAARLIAKVSTISAFAHKKTVGEPFRYPHPGLDYASNLLHMMFSVPYRRYNAKPEVARALDRILILHADHEQNCSTSTVRMVGSSRANLYASVSAGVCALWGPLHGGANMAVIDMLEQIAGSGLTTRDFIDRVKDKSSHTRLMGFGHRVYKNFDPRAKILKEQCDAVLQALGANQRILEIAIELEEAALNDEYFIERNLYPNVDFYSGIILKAIGIPVNMFTVIFAIGRMPGWIAHWREMSHDAAARINRPRQIYAGSPLRDYTPLKMR